MLTMRLIEQVATRRARKLLSTTLTRSNVPAFSPDQLYRLGQTDQTLALQTTQQLMSTRPKFSEINLLPYIRQKRE